MGQSAKESKPEGLISIIQNLEGDFCKQLILDLELRASTSSSSGGPTSENTKIEGDFCKTLSLENQIQEPHHISKPHADVAPTVDPEEGQVRSTGEIEGDQLAIPPRVVSTGVSSVIGRRDEMEDTVAVVPGFFVSASDETYDFFGVYDGHGGAAVSEVCRDRMHVVVAEEAAAAAADGYEEEEEEWWRGVMERSFERVDAEVAGVAASVGSTAVVAVVGPRSIIVANCGDSRAVMSRNGQAVPLSSDHKPNRCDEKSRVELAGGCVVNWQGPRLMGVLATSRSIGDYDLKPFVIPTPELTFNHRTGKDEFMILASDGLWDVIVNEAACKVVRNCLTRTEKFTETVDGHCVELAATQLTRLALLKRSSDNVSVVVVQLTDFLQESPIEEKKCFPCCSI